MKYLFLFLLILLLAGCNDIAPPVTSPNDNYSDIDYGLQVRDINNCQYIIGKSYNGGLAIVHAGNCNNPEHKN